MDSLAIADHLKDHGIKPSYPRIQIYKYLYDKRSHPTVDDIYNNLIKLIPTLSKTTIYNTLDTFIEANLVKSFMLDENEKRYEIIIHDHSHFKCEKCNRIYDIPYGDMDLLPKQYEGFKVNEVQIFLKGVCEKCLK
ncbi:MAG TPA: transcriptional repressor [Tepidimicrobium sp.]|nr:transcriptional repressor [Tepidimicrobium sp.]